MIRRIFFVIHIPAHLYNNLERVPLLYRIEINVAIVLLLTLLIVDSCNFAHKSCVRFAGVVIHKKFKVL